MERENDPRYVPEEYQKMMMGEEPTKNDRPVGGPGAGGSGEGFYRGSELINHGERDNGDMSPIIVNDKNEAYQKAVANPGRAAIFFAHYNPEKVIVKKSVKGPYYLIYDTELQGEIGYCMTENPDLGGTKESDDYQKAS